MEKKPVITTIEEDFKSLGVVLHEDDAPIPPNPKPELSMDSTSAAKVTVTDVEKIEELRKLLGEKILKEKKRSASRRLAKRVSRKRRMGESVTRKPVRHQGKIHESGSIVRRKASVDEAIEALEKMGVILGVIGKKVPVLQEDKDTVVLEYAKYLNESVTALSAEVGTLCEDLEKIEPTKLSDTDLKEIEEAVFGLADDMYEILEAYADVNEITTKKSAVAAAK